MISSNKAELYITLLKTSASSLFLNHGSDCIIPRNGANNPISSICFDPTRDIILFWAFPISLRENGEFQKIYSISNLETTGSLFKWKKYLNGGNRDVEGQSFRDSDPGFPDKS